MKNQNLTGGKGLYIILTGILFVCFTAGAVLAQETEDTNDPEETSKKKKPPKLDAWPKWRKTSAPGEEIDRWPDWERSRNKLPPVYNTSPPGYNGGNEQDNLPGVAVATKSGSDRPSPIYEYSPPGYDQNPVQQHLASAVVAGVILGMFLAFVIGRFIVGGLPSNLLAAGLSVTQQRRALVGSVSIVISFLVLSVGGVWAYHFFTGHYLLPVSFYNIYFDGLWMGVPLVGLILGVMLARVNYRRRLEEGVKDQL